MTQHFFENKNLATEQYELLGNLRQTNKSRIEQTAHQYSAQLDQAKEDRLIFEILPDQKTVYEIDSELFAEQFIKSGGTANSVIICYTNSDVYQYNERVRDILYPNKKSITVGDTIVFYKNNYYTYDEEIIAGDFAKITAVDDEVITRSVERVRNDRSGNPVRIEFKFRKIRFIIIDHPKQKEIETINWYGFHRFVSADYNETEYEGNQVLSMVEKTINTYLKAVQKAKPDGSLIGTDEQIEFAINEAKIIIEKHPEYNWTPYQLSKLLIELNRKDEAEKYLIPFARKNSHFYYVWETLAELYKGKDKDLYYACIFKALTIPNEVKFTVNIRKKAIEYFVNVTEDYAAAKYEIELIHQCIEKENWKTDDTIAALMTRPWYAEANPNKNNRNLYEKLSEVAEDALYSDIEEKDFYVEWINEARDLIGIILTNEERLIVKDAKLAKELEESSFYVAKIYTEGRPRIIGDCTVSENEQFKNKFIIQFSGIFEKIKDFGFIRHSNYNVFVNPALIDEYNIENYSRMTTINRKKFNSRKSIWEWEVHEIVNIERPQLENFEKEITGQLRETEHGFGFIDKCFVSANLINDNDIFDGDTVKVKAKKSWDRQKNEWSWRAEEVVE